MTVDASPEPAVRPGRTRTFRRYNPITNFTPDQTRRQSDLLRSAWRSLKSKEAVISFLNTSNDRLGGVPLSLAMASEDGLRSAETLLGEMHLEPRKKGGAKLREFR